MTDPANTRFLRRTVYETLTPEQVVERYAAGASLDELGFATGTSGHRVRRLLVAHGVTIRPACRTVGPNPKRFVRKS